MTYPSTHPRQTARDGESASPDHGDDEYADFIATLSSLRDAEMRGFTPGIAPADDPEGVGREYRFEPRAASVADVISLLLAAIPAHRLPAFDRVAWEYAFEFDGGVPCRLRWGKGGLRLTLWLVDGDSVRADQLGREVERRLTRAAVILYRRALLPRVRRELAQSRVTVLNQYVRYRGMADYFIEQLQRVRGVGPTGPETDPDEDAVDGALAGIVETVRQVLAGAQHRREVAYLATALVAAYFAYIQHVLVMLSAFSPRALEEGFSVTSLLQARWAEQFNIAFPPPHQGNAGRPRHELRQLADMYRNPLLHGGGGRPGDGMFVDWAPGRSILVTADGELTDQFMLWQPALSDAEIDNILARISRIDQAFDEQPWFPWVRAGLQVDFHTEAVRRSLDAIKRGEVQAYTSAAADALDHAVNWD